MTTVRGKVTDHLDLKYDTFYKLLIYAVEEVLFSSVSAGGSKDFLKARIYFSWEMICQITQSEESIDWRRASDWKLMLHSVSTNL